MKATDTPYLLLTPGPLSTSRTVREFMLSDWCTWDDDYNQEVVEKIRSTLVSLATDTPGYTSVLMQGSGTAAVEATLGTVISNHDRLLVINNGAYGARMAEIARYLNIDHQVLNYRETQSPTAEDIDRVLTAHRDITHVAMVHCETTTGMLNPLQAIALVVKHHQRQLIIDAMSSFGGIPMDIGKLGIDYLISSANKCFQGVPGFGLVIAREEPLAQCQNQARSLTLDLYAQWRCMEINHGKWRFTSPTHTVRAFYQALEELNQEGGISARHRRYLNNQRRLVQGLEELGFQCLLPRDLHSPFITSFYSPDHPDYHFNRFYQKLKQQGFVIYPGKVSDADCFRIGTIGEIYANDIARLIQAIASSMFWERPPHGQ